MGVLKSSADSSINWILSCREQNNREYSVASHTSPGHRTASESPVNSWSRPCSRLKISQIITQEQLLGTIPIVYFNGESVTARSKMSDFKTELEIKQVYVLSVTLPLFANASLAYYKLRNKMCRSVRCVTDCERLCYVMTPWRGEVRRGVVLPLPPYLL
ncbi:hypothetical protein J6590_020058 [Homalodisca vitripennis]|nr:hypothetical protein J6590_020058 [Homalodisca vitripennis]